MIYCRAVNGSDLLNNAQQTHNNKSQSENQSLEFTYLNDAFSFQIYYFIFGIFISCLFSSQISFFSLLTFYFKM